jgi:hypothetical protein
VFLIEPALYDITPQLTLYSAIFSSAARVHLASESGLSFESSSQSLHRIAGKIADVLTLQAACELGLALTAEVLIGAAQATDVSKLQWLHTERDCPLPWDIDVYAARCGNLDALRWLKEQGTAFNERTCEAAAAGGHTHALHFLHSDGCAWNERACSAAATRGHLTVLRWLHEHGCAWDADEICIHAAGSGCVELVAYAHKHGGVLDELVMEAAASVGHLAACQYLVAQQCPCDVTACSEAASNGHLQIVRFLHESGCRWDATALCFSAARSGDLELLRYLHQQNVRFATSAHTLLTAAQYGQGEVCNWLREQQCPWDHTVCTAAARGGHLAALRWLHEVGCPWNAHAIRSAAVQQGHVHVLEFMLYAPPAASAAQLTELLNIAGSSGMPTLAHWLRLQGAAWPAVLRHGGVQWSGAILLWARDLGCTSPLR